jgi:hypothetical protein
LWFLHRLDRARRDHRRQYRSADHGHRDCQFRNLRAYDRRARRPVGSPLNELAPDEVKAIGEANFYPVLGTMGAQLVARENAA